MVRQTMPSRPEAMPSPTEPGGPAIPAMLGGSVAGVALSGPGTLAVTDEEVELSSEANAVAVPLPALDGVSYRDGRLTLFLQHGESVFAEGTPRLAAVSRDIAARVCTLPELTRPLRALGSRRGRLGSEHDRFFAPLLSARRRAERGADPRAILRAFDARAIATTLDATISDFARSRFQRRAPERRALEAELQEIVAPLLTALEALEVYSARALSPESDDTRFVRWRSCCGAIQDVFERADRCWIELGAILGEAPVRRPLWRRVLRLKVFLGYILP